MRGRLCLSSLVFLVIVGIISSASATICPDYTEEACWLKAFTTTPDNWWDVEHQRDKLPNGASALPFKGTFLRPLSNSSYTSRAMEPRDLKGSEVHRGPDIQSVKDSVNVYCPVDGTVSFIQDEPTDSYGKYIVIYHEDGFGNGLYTRYAHLSEILVSQYQEVQRGNVIGLTGNTGQGSGYHLHFEVYSKYGGKTYYLYPAAYFFGTTGNPDYVRTPTTSGGRTLSVVISVYSANTRYSKVQLVYRDRSRPDVWNTVSMSTSDPDTQTVRTFTWSRPSALDNKTLDLYIVGRYNISDYDVYVCTRPAGSFILSSSSASLGVEANPGRYYSWVYPGSIVEPDKDENIVFLDQGHK